MERTGMNVRTCLCIALLVLGVLSSVTTVLTIAFGVESGGDGCRCHGGKCCVSGGNVCGHGECYCHEDGESFCEANSPLVAPFWAFLHVSAIFLLAMSVIGCAICCRCCQGVTVPLRYPGDQFLCSLFLLLTSWSVAYPVVAAVPNPPSIPVVPHVPFGYPVQPQPQPYPPPGFNKSEYERPVPKV